MILVTGGAGFIGSNIVAALCKAQHRVVVCDVFGDGEKWKNLRKHPVHEIVLPTDCMRWLGDNRDTVSAVVHMGAITSTTETDVDALMSENLRFSISLWRLCALYGIPLIYASSAATYGDGAEGFSDNADEAYLKRLRPLNPYGWSKHLFDQHVSRAVASGELQPPFWGGLKFFNVFGPNEYHKGSMMSVVAKNYSLVAAGEPVRLFKSYKSGVADGEQRRDFVFVEDCVSVVLWMLAGKAPSGLYNVGSGEARTFVDLIQSMAAACGRSPAIEFVEMPVAIRANYQYWTEADLTRLQRAGYSAPMTSLEQGVAAYVSRYLMRQDPYC